MPGTGLDARYYAGTTLSGSPVLSQTDPTVDFTQSGGKPFPASLPSSDFSARWSGYILADYTQTYTFYTSSDDGVRLWVNGVLVVDNWTAHEAVENSGNITLTAGQWFSITMEYYQQSGDFAAQLYWSSPSVSKAIVPQSSLFVSIPGPAAPSLLAATAVSTTQIALDWQDNSVDENIFKIQRKTASAETWQQIDIVGTNVTTYQNTGLAPGTLYSYRVTSNNTNGDSAFSNEVSVATRVPAGVPVAPADLALSITSSSQIDLTWSDASSDETGFKIERKTGLNGLYAQIGTTGAGVTTFQSVGLTAGFPYYYRVRATNAAGDSLYSDQANATPIDPGLAGTPIGTSGSYGGNPDVVFGKALDGDISTFFDSAVKDGSWLGLDLGAGVSKAISSVRYVPRSGYALRMIGGRFQGSNSADFSNPVELYTIAVAPSDGVYTTAPLTYAYGFRYIRYLSPSDSFGNVSEVEFCGHDAPVSVSAPSPPSGLTATSDGATRVNLAWADNSSDETSFKVEMKLTSAGTYALIGTTAANTHAFQIDGLAETATYYFRVSATNSTGASVYSNETSVSTGQNAPAGLTAVSASSTQIDLAWQDTSTIEIGVQIERKGGSAPDFVPVAVLGANITSYQDGELAFGTEYTYRVRFTRDAETTGSSNEASATTQTPGFVNPGVYSQVTNGMLYEWIPTRDVTFQVTPEGKVKITAPLTKPSLDSSQTCNRFIYDFSHTRLSVADSAALFGDGLALGPGNYGFAILWIHADTYDEVLNGAWPLTNNPDTYASNSTRPDYFNISIVPVSPPVVSVGEVQEVVIPYDLQRVSWLPHYQLLPYNLRLPPDRGFGITRLLADIPLAQVYEKVTQIQYSYSFLDSAPRDRMWVVMRAYGESNEQLIQQVSLDPAFGYLSQMDEDFGAMGVQNHLERAQEVLHGIYDRLKNERGITSPNQTRLYDDYFTDLGGYSNSVSFNWQFSAADAIAGLGSQAAARKRGDGSGEDCVYFSSGAYEFRNWMEAGYLDSFARVPEGIRIFNEIYNYEKRFMAAPDRRVAKMGWMNAEGVNSTMFRGGTSSRLHFPTGDIIRYAEVTWPFEMMVNEGFWATLLGNDFYLWHSNVPQLTEIKYFGDSGAAGAGDTLWQPTGGNVVTYDPNNASQPARTTSPLGIFPSMPHFAESGGFAGAWLTSQLTTASDRISQTMEYAPFSYKVNNGTVQTGYYNSNNPSNGSLGNAKLSRYGVQNFNQSNIVKTFVARKPICIYTRGVNGGALIYQNVYCGLADVNDVTVTTPSGPKSFQTKGSRLHIFYLGAAATVLPATNLGKTGVTLNGKMNPDGHAATAYFEYGTSTSYGSTAAITLAPGDGNSMQDVTVDIGGLLAGTLYHFRLTFTNEMGVTQTADGTFTTLMSAQQSWRQFYFGDKDGTGIGADNEDPDHDGIVNLLEWALNLNPTSTGQLPITVAPAEANMEYTYTRSVAALSEGTQFLVEWSETLEPGSWSRTGVTEQIVSTDGTVQVIKALVPTGVATRRFIHLKVVSAP